MKIDKKSMILYAVTDRTWLNGKSLEETVETAVKNGVTFLQLREKNIPFNELLNLAEKLSIIAKKAGIPFVINDNAEAAAACNCDGVHLGQNDMPVYEARAILGNDKIIGVTAKTVEQAVSAEKNGADYIGSGAVFNTSTKTDAVPLSLDELKNICASVSIPVIAIGGINKNNILQLKGTGISGVAVVSAIFAQNNIANAAKELFHLSRKVAEN